MRMAHKNVNIPQNISCSTTKGEFLRIARLALSLNDFVAKVKELLNLVEIQDSKRNKTNNSLKKISKL